MKNFCLYNGKKIVKPEIWNITSVELSSDYTSAIIQAESKSNKSEYTLDITPLISNQYEGGLDPYSTTIVNELTGVSDWVLDSDNNSIKYKQKCINQCIPESGTYAVIALGQNATPTKDSFSKSENVKNYPDEFEAKKSLCYGAGGYRISAPNTCIGYKESGDYIVGNMDSFWFEATKPQEEEYLPLDVVAQKVISNANAGNTNAQNSIVSTFNNITDDILTSDYSEFFEQNKQPK